MLFERKSKEVKLCIPQIKLVKLKVVAKIYNVIGKMGAYSELNHNYIEYMQYTLFKALNVSHYHIIKIFYCYKTAQNPSRWVIRDVNETCNLYLGILY